MKWFIFLLLVLFSTNAFSQDKVFFETLPVPEGVQPSSDPSIPNIAWNRWTTRNFTVHSIDVDQGKYLFNNIEQMKTWTFERWGLADIRFTSETANEPNAKPIPQVKVFCAPDAVTMKKLFNMESSFGETRVENGKIKISHLWLVLDVKPSEVIPASLTVIALKEYEQQTNKKFGWWVHRGMPVLNMTLPQIRGNIVTIEGALGKDSGMFFSKALLEMTEENWKSQSPELKRLFDSQAATMCLLVRKEFGQDNFHAMMNQQASFQTVLGFRDNAELDATFKRYMVYLTQDIRQNKTPNDYLQIQAK